MKKIFLFLLFALILPSAFTLAKEEAPSQPLNLAPIQERIEGPSLAFEFAFSPGKLSKAQTGKIFTTGYHASNFTLPSLKENPAPIRYPRWAVREGWEGTFVIAVEILTTGEVGRWKVIESTGYSLLDESATASIRKWHFHPGTENGKAVAACIQIPVYFQLEE